VRALQAGKHVLCEKPLASNAQEAEAMAEAATRAGRVLMEAFHYRYHPLAERMRTIVAQGTLGQVRHIETWMCVPLPLPRDIRYNLALAGGTTMDTGCYAIHMLRTLAAAEPEVVAAQAHLARPGIDRWMRAEFRFADGRTGRMTCALWSRALLRIAAQVTGDAGDMSVLNPFAPQRYHRLTVRTRERTWVEQSSQLPSYLYQLRAFADAVLRGKPLLAPPADAVANMRVIDAVYQAAGLPLRGAQAGHIDFHP
jgi:predicted dehydrogenase